MSVNPICSARFTAQINGLELSYQVSGHGPVCIHPTPGWGPSSELYARSLTPLEELFTMVYMDTRGSGRSQRPPALTGYAMRDFVADLEGLRQHLGEDRVWLMGHSNGGAIVLHYACGYPERAQGLIVVDSPVENTGQGEGRAERMRARRGEPWYEEAMERWNRMPQTQEEFDTYLWAIMPFFFRSIDKMNEHESLFKQSSSSFHAYMGQQQADISWGDLASDLTKMETPTLIVAGADDFLYPPAAAEAMRDLIAHAKLLMIERAGHFPWLEQPERFFDGIKALVPELGYRTK